ncbi:transposase domain-containing protein [Mycobacterium sp. GA-2829]|uniref:transposase domain-containing protein n=1 Tax=Mycobacterium sp. GA-2829 TaxID=1772283 RepID=UPI00073FB936|nr:transposase domain-containing protein [Mycobacterium sp. GA-2829]KUI26618.1 hypothetical protein AU194_19685 [Mycobacterium sp. GA-2829]
MRDRLALCALVSAVPPVVVDEALQDAGVVAERIRTLPPWVTAYHVLGSAMCPPAGYDEVTDLLWTALPAVTGRGLSRQRPTTGAITRARSRLGVEPLDILLRRLIGATSGCAQLNAVELHRFDQPGRPGLWWIADPHTGSTRGCDVRASGLDAAVSLVRCAGVSRVAAALPVEARAALQQRVGGSVWVDAAAPKPAEETPWSGLRARSSVAWQQEALARACVDVALEWASSSTRSQSHVRY